MTVIEYAEKLGIELTDSQKGMLNIWQESDNKSAMFILSMPRCEGRQMIYDLIQRYRGYEQGRADAIDEALAYCNQNNDEKEECWNCCLSVWEDGQFAGCYLEQLKEQRNG